MIRWIMLGGMLVLAVPAWAQMVPDPTLVHTWSVVAAGVTLPAELKVFRTKGADATGQARNMVWLRYAPAGRAPIEMQVVRGPRIRRPPENIRYEEDVCVIDWATGSPTDPTMTQTGGDEHRTFCCGAQERECQDELCVNSTGQIVLCNHEVRTAAVLPPAAPVTKQTLAATQATAHELLALLGSPNNRAAGLGGITFQNKWRYEEKAIRNNLAAVASPPVTINQPSAQPITESLAEMITQPIPQSVTDDAPSNVWTQAFAIQWWNQPPYEYNKLHAATWTVRRSDYLEVPEHVVWTSCNHWQCPVFDIDPTYPHTWCVKVEFARKKHAHKCSCNTKYDPWSGSRYGDVGWCGQSCGHEGLDDTWRQYMAWRLNYHYSTGKEPGTPCNDPFMQFVPLDCW